IVLLRHSRLTEFAQRLELARPVLRKQAGRHVAVKRRERPIAYTRDKSMLHGINVAIFNVTAVVLLIPDQVLPETALPYTALTARATDFAQPLRPRDRLREHDLDQSPSHRKIRVSFGQSPNRVNVVGQYDECADVEWVPLACAARGLTQGFDLVGQKSAATIEEICREEPASSRDKRAPVIWHAAG